MRPRRIPLAALTLALASACARPPPPVTPPPTTTWTDPEGRFTIDLPGTPVAQDKQELSSLGTVNFKFYGVDLHPYHYRVSAFAYPHADGAPFDVVGELGHASGKAIVRMRGKVDDDRPIEVGGVQGLETTFSFTTEDGERGHGVQRVLIASPPVRYHAFCLTPVDVDLAPCKAFVRSLKPIRS